MSEPTFNQNPYFTNEQLEVLSKEYRTIPVDDEGYSFEPEYNNMIVRSDVLKLISDVRQGRRKQYKYENEVNRLSKKLLKVLHDKNVMVNYLNELLYSTSSEVIVSQIKNVLSELKEYEN